MRRSVRPGDLRTAGGGLSVEDFRGRIIDRNEFIATVARSFADLLEPEDPLEAAELHAARRGLLPFIQHLMPTYKADPFHVHLTGYLDKVVAREIPALMVYAPPQHGKSVAVSQMLPAYHLAQHPELPILLTSYAAARAHDNSRRARAIAMSPMYARLFGGRVPDPSNWRAFHWAFDGLPGYVYAAGLGGPITGLGFGLGIIDDPHESWEQAQSETYRRRAWEWYQGTYTTRLWEDAPTVFITTRWHEDDLAGRVLDEEGTVEEGGRWLVLRYPALAEAEDEEHGVGPDIIGRQPGEPLAPSRFSRKHLLAVRQRLGGPGALVWNAEYQQRPTRPAGDMFKIGRIDILDAIPATIGRLLNGKPVEVKKGVRFWDLAATTKKRGKRDPDYTSGTMLSEEPGRGKFWILDQIKDRLEPEQVDDLILQTAKVDGKGVRVRIELQPAAAGKMLADYHVKMLAGFDVEVVPASGDPTIRAHPWASQVNVGNVILLKAPWNKDFLQEHAQFPNAQHDDQVTSASGAFGDITADRKKFREQKFAHV